LFPNLSHPPGQPNKPHLTKDRQNIRQANKKAKNNKVICTATPKQNTTKISIQKNTGREKSSEECGDEKQMFAYTALETKTKKRQTTENAAAAKL